MTQPVSVAIVGCGNIATPYAKYLKAYPETDLIGLADLEIGRAQALANEVGGQVYPDLDELLADDRVEIVVNLTIHHAHYDIIRHCLEAGKHVHSEKPLALTYAEARALVELAEAQGVRLGCSPFTFMGEAQQTAWKIARSGRLGQVRLAYAEVNWGRIEQWHPNPAPFYSVGPLVDVGVYPLTLLTAMFGPVRRVVAYQTTLSPQRQTQTGHRFEVTAPDLTVALLELEQGPLIRLTCDFYVHERSSQQRGIELHGDQATLYLSSWHDFDGMVKVGDFGEALRQQPLLKSPHSGVEWGRAVRDLAQAIREDRPHRATGEQAAHIVEVLEAIQTAAGTGQPVAVASTFTPPAMMPWAGGR